jgi:hypothetical protein
MPAVFWTRFMAKPAELHPMQAVKPNTIPLGLAESSRLARANKALPVGTMSTETYQFRFGQTDTGEKACSYSRHRGRFPIFGH